VTITYLALADTDQIRATLGADVKDLPDADLTNYDLENELRGNLLDWLPTYATVISEGDAGSPTTAQELKYLKLLTYSKCFLSWLVGQSAQNFMMQKYADGSNEMQRFKFDQSALMQSLVQRYEGAKADILELIDSTEDNTVPQFGVVTAGYDAVTNT